MLDVRRVSVRAGRKRRGVRVEAGLVGERDRAVDEPGSGGGWDGGAGEELSVGIGLDGWSGGEAGGAAGAEVAGPEGWCVICVLA